MSIPLVYSYLRFSTPEQALGDSERRQLDDAKAWVARKGLALDESLQMTDRGLSGYHGVHRTKGALGRFLAAVGAGEVPAGSILLVENVDRLSREGAVKTIREIIGKLWDRGITLQTLSPEETYEPGCDNNPKFIALFIYIQRAFDESKRKSERIRSVRNQERQKAREEKRVLTRKCPAWLRVTEAGKYEAIPEAAETIRMIFDLRLGGMGLPSLEKRLNAVAPWTPPPTRGGGRPRKDGRPTVRQLSLGWRTSYIKKILRNPAVIGECNPMRLGENGVRVAAGEPITDYYPAVVAPEVYHAVAKQMASNRGKGGRTGKARNLLVHLARCPYCGGPMAHVKRGTLNGLYGVRFYLVCDQGRRGVRDEKTGEPVCRWHSIRYDECEELLLRNCLDLRPERVLPNPGEQVVLCKNLRQRLVAREAEVREAERKIGNLVDQIAECADRDTRRLYEEKVAQLRESRDAAQAEWTGDKQRLDDAERSGQSFAAWQQSLKDLTEALKGGDPALREKVRAHLRELIVKVEVFADGYARRYDPRRDGPADDVEDWGGMVATLMQESDPDWRADAEWKAFAEYVMARRMTREGRFIRVHFKTGADVDLVPPGSLAVGRVMVDGMAGGKAWELTPLNIDRLWKEFRARPTRRRRKVGG